MQSQQSGKIGARFKNHVRSCFCVLTLGWSDRHTLITDELSLLSSSESQLDSISMKIDKRTCSYKRTSEAFLPAPEVLPLMLDRALATGINASHVLIDSWFTYAKLIQIIKERGLEVIGIVKTSTSIQ